MFCEIELSVKGIAENMKKTYIDTLLLPEQHILELRIRHYKKDGDTGVCKKFGCGVLGRCTHEEFL